MRSFHYVIFYTKTNRNLKEPSKTNENEKEKRVVRDSMGLR